MEKLTPAVRSRVMSKVRGKNTSPEIRVRRTLHTLGYRFRLHGKDLPGKPDVVLPKYRLCVFVHGCFWHQHPGCKRATMPVNNHEFWIHKLAQNEKRDEVSIQKLKILGWDVLVIWECETKNVNSLIARLCCISDISKKQLIQYSEMA